MRIITKMEFLAMPAETVYCEFHEGALTTASGPGKPDPDPMR